MQEPLIPEYEDLRLTALRHLDLLDTAAEERFDRITRVAQRYFHVPFALVSLVDAERQWFKSKQGLDACETTRGVSFCGHAILQDDIFCIPDALLDPRFVDNPLVNGGLNVRFYAGAPLHAPNGQRVGTLCVIDIHPRHPSADELAVLRDLADTVEAELERGYLFRAKTELAQKEQRLQQIIHVSPGVIYARDAKDAHNITYVSAQLTALLGHAPRALTANTTFWLDHVHPDDRAPALKNLEALFDVDQNTDEYRMRRADGSYRWVQDTRHLVRGEKGDPVEIVGLWMDISERKDSEAALREQVQHTQAILDNVIDGIITIDERGTIASFNQAAERIFGYSPGQVIGRNIKMLMPEPFHGEHDGYLANYRATSVPRIIGIGREVVGQRSNGETFPMDLAVSEISHQGQRMFVGLARDITDRKRVEQMKSEFVSTVSHELRTPLTSISGSLGLLLGGALGDTPPQMKTLLQIAHKNSLRLNHLISDLLDMEKITAGKMHFDMQLVELMPLVEQSLETNKAYGEQRDVKFALVQRADDVVVRIDGHRFEQVLANFLSNAAKFSPSGGCVEVTVQLRDERVRLAVRDHGPGIPPAFRSRIFQKFSQADSSDTREKGGTGLGLAITKELIERMGGTVGFDSIPGEGATFWAELPVHSPVLASNGHAPVPQRFANADADAPSILVVEDDHEISHLLSLMLQRAGYHTAIAYSGEKALEMLERRQFSAMTLDLKLPGINGLEVIRRVRRNPATIDLPVIVISASVEHGRLSVDGEFTAVDWLSKPFDERHLLAMMEQRFPKLRPDHPQRVLHVEDDSDLHRVVRAMASDAFEFEHAANLAQARAILAKTRFDVVILDQGLPDGSGLELLPLLRELSPTTRVVILSGTELETSHANEVQAYLLKSNVSPQQLLDALSERLLPNKGVS